MNEVSLVKKKYIEYIDKIIENKRISHAYLIEIDHYEEDMPYVFSFIKMILAGCSYEESKVSNHPIFSQIDHSNYPDVRMIAPMGNMIKKNQLLELQEDFNNKSLLDGKRIYVIQEAEKMNSASANTILKFLEEPEENIIAILLTNNRYHVIPTILSRCQVISLKERKQEEYDSSVLELLKVVLNPRSFFIQYSHFLEGLLADKEVGKKNLIQVENILIHYFESLSQVGEPLSEEMNEIVEKVDSDVILKTLSIMEEEIPKLEFNVNYKLWLDSLFSRFINGG